MLEIAILALLAGTIYTLVIAPAKDRVLVAAVIVVLTAVGYGAGLAITTAGTDQRTFYPIAAAIGGAMIAFAWLSKRSKSWPKKPAVR